MANKKKEEKKEVEKSRELTRDVAFSVDDSYLSQQICGISTQNLEVVLEYGLWKSGESGCPDHIEWFQEGGDFVVISREGTLEVSREDIEDSSTAYKQTTSGQVEWTREMTIKPTFGSRLYQKFMDIQIRDGQGGYNGQLYRIYSDGGAHFRITINSLDGSFSLRQVSLNVKLSSFLDTFFLDLNDNEVEATLSHMVEYSPIYEIIGELPNTFAVPTGTTAPEITLGTITNTLTSLDITTVDLIDPDFFAYDENVKIKLYDENDILIDEVDVLSGSPATFSGTFTTGQNLKIQAGYSLSANYQYFIKVEEYLTT